MYHGLCTVSFERACSMSALHWLFLNFTSCVKALMHTRSLQEPVTLSSRARRRCSNSLSCSWCHENVPTGFSSRRVESVIEGLEGRNPSAETLKKKATECMPLQPYALTKANDVACSSCQVLVKPARTCFFPFYDNFRIT